MGIRVRATRTGYMHLRRYREGEEFELESEKQFSRNWMEKVFVEAAKKSKKGEDA